MSDEKKRPPTVAELAELVLLFHGGGQWSDDKRARWRELTGHDEATTKVLCDVARLVRAAPHAIVSCPKCGPQPLTEAQYLAQLDDVDARWVCPRCQEVADFDDDAFERLHPDVLSSAPPVQPC